MATRGRGKRVPFDTKAGFRKQQGNESREGVHAQILKQARQSGQLNLSGRGLETGVTFIPFNTKVELQVLTKYKVTYLTPIPLKRPIAR